MVLILGPSTVLSALGRQRFASVPFAPEPSTERGPGQVLGDDVWSEGAALAATSTPIQTVNVPPEKIQQLLGCLMSLKLKTKSLN